MNIKIHQSSSATYNNSGSSYGIASYLDHEDRDRLEEGKDIERFFNLTSDNVAKQEVIKGIDQNKGQLGKADAKFFCITVSPSDKELQHLGKTPEEQALALKEYVKREVIPAYADNFKKDLKAEDIRFYAKIHHDRDRRELGNNVHCHIIISRKDNANKRKLSPLTNHKATTKGVVKGGFERTELFRQCEQRFDKKFSYDRDLTEKFDHCNALKNGTLEEKISAVIQANQKSQTSQERNQDKDQEQKNTEEKQKDKGLEHPAQEETRQKTRDMDIGFGI